MSNDSILLILSDHGQTNNGNHGGDTEEETTSYIFATLKGNNKFNKEYTSFIKEKEFQFLNKRNDSNIVARDKYLRFINLVDMTPTISRWLGLPIPFNNLGVFVPEMEIGDGTDIFSYCKANLE
jgi:phosphatidylinositol glycan class O